MMIKKLLILLLFLGFSFGQGNLSPERVSSHELVMRDNVLYKLDDYISVFKQFLEQPPKIGLRPSIKPYSGYVYTVKQHIVPPCDSCLYVPGEGEYGSYIFLEYELKNGIKHGSYRLWDDNGENIVLEGYFEDGKKVGIWKSYQQETIVDIYYEDGIKQKQIGFGVVEYFEDGKYLFRKPIYESDEMYPKPIDTSLINK